MSHSPWHSVFRMRSKRLTAFPLPERRALLGKKTHPSPRAEQCSALPSGRNRPLIAQPIRPHRPRGAPVSDPASPAFSFVCFACFAGTAVGMHAGPEVGAPVLRQRALRVPNCSSALLVSRALHPQRKIAFLPNEPISNPINIGFLKNRSPIYPPRNRPQRRRLRTLSMPWPCLEERRWFAVVPFPERRSPTRHLPAFSFVYFACFAGTAVEIHAGPEVGAPILRQRALRVPNWSSALQPGRNRSPMPTPFANELPRPERRSPTRHIRHSLSYVSRGSRALLSKFTPDRRSALPPNCGTAVVCH